MRFRHEGHGPAVTERILRHLGFFDRPRAPNPYDCLTPPVDPRSQALILFPQLHSTNRNVMPFNSDDAGPQWHGGGPVDPPFEDD